MHANLQKYWYALTFFCIILIATLIRFYNLGEVPHGMTWDEAAIGYNGFALFETRRDEWLERLPVSFRSFGDFKAPLAIYVNGLFTAVFGMNLFAVRLPFALAGVGTVLGSMLLALEVFARKKYVQEYSLLVGFLFATSSWHIHYSRAGFESGIGLFFFIWGLYFFFQALKKNFTSLFFTTISLLSFVACLYTYHSPKVTLPLLAIVILILYFKKIITQVSALLIPIFLAVAALIPLVKDSFFGSGLTRAGVTIFSSADISFGEKISYIVTSFFQHLSLDFLLFAQTTTLRHGTGFLGVLFLTTFVSAVLGLVSLVYTKNIDERKHHFFFIAVLLLGLLPASIALEVPHSNRAILALPGFLFLSVFGVSFVVEKLEAAQKQLLLKSIVGVFILVHSLYTITFVQHYFAEFAQSSATDFNDGYLEAFSIAQKYEKGQDGYPQVEKIVFTSDYGQPYIYALFVRKTNPIWYQGGSLIKYEFYETINHGDLTRNNALIVGSATDDLPTSQADHLIYGSDGQLKFQLFVTQKRQE